MASLVEAFGNKKFEKENNMREKPKMESPFKQPQKEPRMESPFGPGQRPRMEAPPQGPSMESSNNSPVGVEVQSELPMGNAPIGNTSNNNIPSMRGNGRRENNITQIIDQTDNRNIIHNNPGYIQRTFNNIQSNSNNKYIGLFFAIICILIILLILFKN